MWVGSRSTHDSPSLSPSPKGMACVEPCRDPGADPHRRIPGGVGNDSPGPAGRRAHPADHEAPAATADDLPNPLEDKRRELRKPALSDVLVGTPRRGPQERFDGGQGRPKAAPLTKAEQRAKAGKTVKQRKVDQYVELSREKTDQIFVVLAEFGNERHPHYPDQDTDPDHARARRPSTARCTTRSPSRTARKDNSTVWQPDYNRAALPGPVLRHGRGSSRSRPTTRSSPRAATASTATVTDWVKVQYNEARYGRSNGFPCAGNVCSNTWNLVRDARRHVGRRPEGRRPHRRADQGRAGRRSTSGTATTTTATATSTSRTATSTTSRSCTPAATRPTATPPGRGRHLVAPLERLPGHRPGPGRTTRSAAPRSATPASGSATTRSSRRTAACRVFAHEYGHDLGLPDHYDTATGGDNARRAGGA